MHALILLKPDVFERRLWGVALEWLQRQTDLKIIDARMFHPSVSTDGRLVLHYQEHEGKDFYPGLMAFMRSGPVMAIRGHTFDIPTIRDAVFRFRRSWQTDGPRNLIHCSDSEEAATREIDIWFPTQ